MNSEFAKKALESANIKLYQVRMAAYEYDPQYLALRTGISVATVYNFRSGRTVWPRPKTLFPLLDFLGFRLVLQHYRLSTQKSEDSYASH